MKKWISLIISCFFLFCIQYLPINIGLTTEANQMIGIFIGAIIMWLTIGIDWTSVLVLFALALLPSVGVNAVMAASLGNNTIAFLIFSCIFTYALSQTGFLRRAALWFINTKIAKKSPWHFAAMYFISILIIGSFIAPTVLFILFFALAKEIYEVSGQEKGSPYARMLMIGTAIMTSISCAMTPIAHTFPLMAIGFYETEFASTISWIKYMAIGIPAGLIVATCTFGLLYKGFKNKISGLNLNVNLVINEKISIKEIISVIMFGIVVIMWLLIGIIPTSVPFLKMITTTGPAMIGVIVLCALGILNFKDAITKGVPWQSIILCAATLAIGKWLTSTDFGITALIGNSIAPLTNGIGAFELILLICSFAIIMTNLMSNIVTTTVSYNILIPIIVATGIINPALATVLIGMGASMAYATPPAIAHIALAAGSEYTDSKDMLRYGGIISIVSIIVVCGLGFIFRGIF